MNWFKIKSKVGVNPSPTSEEPKFPNKKHEITMPKCNPTKYPTYERPVKTGYDEIGSIYGKEPLYEAPPIPGTNDTSRLDEIFKRSDSMVACDFCGKSSTQVINMIVKDKVAICNECVGICNKLLEETKNEIHKPNYSEIILENPKAFVNSLSIESGTKLQLELLEFYKEMNMNIYMLEHDIES